MAALKQINLLKVTNIGRQTVMNFHVNPVVYDRKWRLQRNMTANPNAFGPLTNLPDYSFKDGRPVPYGTHQKRRIDEQRENLTRIEALISEIDHAVINHEKRTRLAMEEKQNILDRKLKGKGNNLPAAGSETLTVSDSRSNQKNSKHLTDN